MARTFSPTEKDEIYKELAAIYASFPTVSPEKRVNNVALHLDVMKTFLKQQGYDTSALNDIFQRVIRADQAVIQRSLPLVTYATGRGGKSTLRKRRQTKRAMRRSRVRKSRSQQRRRR